MAEIVEDVKTFVRSFLRKHYHAVPSQRAGSGKVHLEVWETLSGRTRPVGVELGHTSQVNLWFVSMNLPIDLPDTIQRFDKTPKGRIWTDANNDGANSNLSAYEQFRTKKIARIEVRNVADAELLLGHLLS